MSSPLLLKTEEATPPSLLWKVTSVAVLGSFLSQLDATVVNVSLSSLATELHASVSTIQWVTSGYLIALALMLPLNGWLVDRIGAKTLYLWCFAAFTASSALCGFAWSADSLIAFRVLQGMSGGLMAPMAQMMIARVAGGQMARVMGYAALPILLGPILGPVLAGAILQHGTWRWLFFINLPVGVLAIALSILFLPDDRGEIKRRSFDLPGFLLLSPGLVLFLYGADHVRERLGLITLAVAAVLLVCFLRWATRLGAHAIIDLDLFRGSVFPRSAVTQFVQNGVSFAGQLLIPYFLIRACGRTPGATGWLLAPLGLGMLVVYPCMGLLSRRLGVRKLASAGALLSLLGTVPFVILAARGFVLPLYIAALFVRGMGLGAVGIPSISAAYASVKKEELPMATTALNIVQRLGGPTFTTVCASFLAWRLAALRPSHPGHAFTAAFLLLCGMHALVFLSAMRLPLSIGRPAEELLVEE